MSGEQLELPFVEYEIYANVDPFKPLRPDEMIWCKQISEEEIRKALEEGAELMRKAMARLPTMPGFFR